MKKLVLTSEETISIKKSLQNIYALLLSMESNPLFKQNLKPGEMIKFRDGGKRIVKKCVDTKGLTSWKEGVLYFENNQLPDLLKSLERRYDVHFKEINDPILKEFTLTFTVRNERIGKVMQLIKAALPVKVVTKGGVIELELDKEQYEKYKKITR